MAIECKQSGRKVCPKHMSIKSRVLIGSHGPQGPPRSWPGQMSRRPHLGFDSSSHPLLVMLGILKTPSAHLLLSPWEKLKGSHFIFEILPLPFFLSLSHFPSPNPHPTLHPWNCPVSFPLTVSPILPLQGRHCSSSLNALPHFTTL